LDNLILLRVKGFSQVDINGVNTGLGSETGLKHSFVDTSIINGQRYSMPYCLHFGYPAGNIAPAEPRFRSMFSPDGNNHAWKLMYYCQTHFKCRRYLPPQVEILHTHNGRASVNRNTNVILIHNYGNNIRLFSMIRPIRLTNKEYPLPKLFHSGIYSGINYIINDTNVNLEAELPVMTLPLNLLMFKPLQLNNALTGWE